VIFCRVENFKKMLKTLARIKNTVYYHSMDIKEFAADRFFSVALHPATKIYPPSFFQGIAERLQIAREIAHIRPDFNDPGEGRYVAAPPPENALQDKITPSKDFQYVQAPAAAPAPGGSAELIAPAPAPAAAPFVFDADGYSALLKPVYRLGFDLLSRKTGDDLRLTSEEAQELADATTPVLRKYVRSNFTYAEEMTLVTTLVGVYTRKKIAGEKMEKPTEVETNFTPEAEQFVNTAMPGLANILNQDAVKNAKPIPVDDLTFKKLQQLGAATGMHNLTREEAERYNGIIVAAGFDVNQMVEVLSLIPPEQLKKFAESLPKP